MEIWKTIKNFERYEVSNLGNVRSKDTEYITKDNKKYCFKGKILKLTETKTHNKPNGYIVLLLAIVLMENKTKQKTVQNGVK